MTDATTKEAEAWVQGNVHSNWGGTEIHGALKAVFDVPISKGMPLQERAKQTCISMHSADCCALTW